MKNAIHKLMHWEYWNTNVIYFPIFFYWVYLSFKARSLGFFNASNPSIKNGGFALESKKDIYNLLPKKYYPQTLYFTANETLEKIILEIQKSSISLPLIIKPDIGLQGLRVEKINSWDDLQLYLSKTDYDFIIQECINYQYEIGLFYCKMPNKTKGEITGIVFKEFLKVVGNGKDNIEELLKKNPRFTLQLKTLKRKYGILLQNKLSNGETFTLVPFGNHARGCKFIDVSNWTNTKLNETINTICNGIPDFYYGRLDIMFQSRDDLEEGKNFSIIELNGAGSEPTHIYDPKHSIFFAWKEIIKHYRILYKISTLNHKEGVPYLSFKECIQLVKENKKLTQHLKKIS